MPPETQAIWCFPEAWFQEIVFGRVDPGISSNGVDHAQTFRKTLVNKNFHLIRLLLLLRIL